METSSSSSASPGDDHPWVWVLLCLANVALAALAGYLGWLMLVVWALRGGGWDNDAAVTTLLGVELTLSLLAAVLVVWSPRWSVCFSRGSSGLGLFAGVGLSLFGLSKLFHATTAPILLTFGLAFFIASVVVFLSAVRLARQPADLPRRFSSAEWLAIDRIFYPLMSGLGASIVCLAVWWCARDEYLETRYLVIGLLGAGLIVWSLKRRPRRM